MTKPRMLFQCDQDWDEMKPTACGRFCTVCNKEVHDFRYKSIDEIKRRQEKEEKLCGVFLPEQIEPDLVPVSFGWIDSFKLWLVTIATFFGLETRSAHAQKASKDSVETVYQKQTPGAPVSTNSTIVTKADENGEEIIASPTKSPSNRKSKYYISKRFPFIHKRRKIMGRIRMGCPSF